MYLATLHVTLDLEPEVAQTERAKVLRSLRDRLKHIYGQRITLRTDDDSAIAVAFFDDRYARIKGRLDEVLEAIDNAGEARIALSQSQIYSWFDGRFQETRESLEDGLDGDLGGIDSAEGGGGMGSGSAGRGRASKTIVYHDDDDENGRGGLLPSGLNRRNVRLPTRK